MRSSSVNHIILQTLGHNQAHLTARQVYEHLRERLPAVNPSTIYRALERLVQVGQISVSDMGQGAAVYEAVGGDCHHHLVCQTCGQVQTIGDEAVGSLFSKLELENQFQIVTNHLVLFGRCQSCQSKTG